MNTLIDIAGITTLGTIGAIVIFAASALNPFGAGLVIAGAILWAKQSR